jgi:hypothetical protein
MPIDVKRLTSELEPERTVLFFGAGSSIPSGAPTVAAIQAHLAAKFGVPAEGYTLSEQTGIIEQSVSNRQNLIREVRHLFRGLKPSGAILNLPLYKWKSIYTTNYDTILEESYKRKGSAYCVYTSNYDFGRFLDPRAINIYKLHGSIDFDIVDSSHSRIILTDADYDATSSFREQLYLKLKGDIVGSNLVIIGHSLGDSHIREIINMISRMNSEIHAGGRITLFMYNPDEHRARLLEGKGIGICFGGLDDFIANLVDKEIGSQPTLPFSTDPIDHFPGLRPSTVDVGHSVDTRPSNASGMYNGWPATYSDIKDGNTFRRNIADIIERTIIGSSKFVSILLGPSGVGKTTAARQIVYSLRNRGYLAWEHKQDLPFRAVLWRQLARRLKEEDRDAVLFVDEAHTELGALNELIDGIATDENHHFRLILVSSRNHWYPRIKTPALYNCGSEFYLNKVQDGEVDRLLDLVEGHSLLRRLVEGSFAGFSRYERRRRLIERCEADMFVCLKNIFATEKLDDIVLREYAGLDVNSRDVYKFIAALESSGVKVHRQLVIRLLGIRADHVSAVLTGLTDIIEEDTIDERNGIYAWRGRHSLIMKIIADHKYYDSNRRFDLFSRVIDNISGAYDIEIRTLREFCNIDSGISTVLDKEEQNVLLRKMMSVAPRERVPRHRLIRNLIELGQFETAETEIRLFENDFNLDGPVARYKINLGIARALRSPDLLDEDREVIVLRTCELAASAASRYRANKGVLASYCEAGLAAAKITGRTDIFEIAIQELKDAEERIGDPDIPRMISRFEHRMTTLISSYRIEDEILDE